MDLASGVSWFRGSSVRIRRAGVEVQIDPLGLTESSVADYVLLTHPHYDNFSEEEIARVRGPHTVVIAPASMKKQLEDADHFLRPGDMLQLDGFDVLAVPAYNVDKKFHPAENGWLGYVFTLDGITYYHAGDTDYLDSMATIRCDVAFLPCDGHYTMDADDAVKAAEACGASVLVPVHWGDSWGSAEDVERMRKRFSHEVRILPRAL
jgi:L-ascorbate metabolism protein UlaG (beta-lactamase superfamily)